MGRPRAFDEEHVTRAAALLFASRAYDGVSVDDLVTHLGVHRNSLYKVFGSKRGLYLAALRWHLRHQVQPLLARLSTAPDPAQALREALAGTDLNLLLLALAERAPADPEVAEETGSILRDLDAAVSHALPGDTPGDGTPSPLAFALTATLLGLQLRARAGTGSSEAGAVLLDRIRQPQP